MSINSPVDPLPRLRGAPVRLPTPSMQSQNPSRSPQLCLEPMSGEERGLHHLVIPMIHLVQGVVVRLAIVFFDIFEEFK